MKILGYARVSSRDQSEGKSIDNQIALLKAAGCDEVLFDIESAFKRRDRPNFNKLMGMVRAGLVSKVVVCTLDRLSRNEAVTFVAFDDFEKANCRLVSLEENFDLFTVEGRMMAGMIALVSRSYSAGLGKKVQRGHRRHRERELAYAKIFGYQVVNNKYCFDCTPFLCLQDGKQELSKFDIAKDIIAIFKDARSLRKAVATINLKYGLLTFTQGRGKGNWNSSNLERFSFSVTGLQNWLNNPILRGHTAYRRKDKQHRSNQHHWDIKYDTHSDRLITDLEYKEICDIFDWNAKHHGFKKASTEIYVFSGLLNCGECGRAHRSTFAVNRDGTRRHYYQCQNYSVKGCSQKSLIREDQIEAVVIPKLIEAANQLADFAEIKPEFVENPELRQLRSQLAGLESLPFNLAIESAKENIKAQISSLEHASVQAQTIDIGLRAELIEVFSDRGFFEALLPEDRKALYRHFVERIIVRDRRVMDVVLRI